MMAWAMFSHCLCCNLIACHSNGKTKMDSKALQEKYSLLKEILCQTEGVLIAFSGGVDSTLLLKTACDVLNDKVMAVTAISELMPKREQQLAAQIAQSFSVKHKLLETFELSDDEFVSNGPDRCYVCKKKRFAGLVAIAADNNIKVVADGENIDDKGDYRPGSKAAQELGVISPLKTAGLDKAEIRSLSKSLNLQTWNKLSSACLASRIPYHTPITVEKLDQVSQAENLMRGLGFSGQLRVRHHGQIASVEIEPQAMPRAVEMGRQIAELMKTVGFTYATLDLEGYTMGSLNKQLLMDGK
jgi:uncharacterized protein